MGFKSWFQRWKMRYFSSKPLRTRQLVHRRRSISRFRLEELEDRVVPTAITWTGNDNTLNWNDSLNWSPQQVPTSADDVTINKSGVGTINIGTGVSANVQWLNDTTAGLSIPSSSSLNIAAYAGTSTFGQNVTVMSGGSLTVGSNANVQIGYGVTVTDSGTLTFSTSDTVSFSSAVIAVAAGGQFNATGTTFSGGNGQIDFNAVGVIGTLTGNSFNLPIYLPATDIQPLSANGNNNVQFQDIYIQTGTLLSGQNVNLNAIGTQTGSLLYIFNGSLTIDSGASITVAPGVNTQVAYGVTVTDSGTLTFSTSDTVSFSSAVIAVAADGQFNATGTTFSGGNGQIDFNAVGVVGTLTGNSFNLPIYLPATDIQPLSANGNNNVQFQDIYIQTGTLLSGQNVNLNAIGTQTGSLLYIFNGSLTIDSGASITVAPGVNTQVAYGVTVTDSGTLTFSTSDTVSFSSAVIAVAAGGQFNATGTTFSGGNGQIDFNAVGVVGTLTGNSFNLPIYLPATDIQPLSANGNNNVQFQDIYIQTGTLLSGQNVNLNAIGTQTGSLLYIFNGSLTIDSGASITVAPGVNTQVAYGVTVTDSGTLTFSTSDTVSFSSAVIAVAAGGQFNATGTTFSGGNGQIDFNAVGVVGTLTGNSFNLPIYLPATDIQPLSANGNNNVQFQDIYIQTGTLLSGQNVNLNAIGTQTGSLLYIFNGSLTIDSGASITVAPGVNTQVAYGVTVTDSGTLTFSTSDTVSFSSSAVIAVAAGGQFNATGTTFSGGNGQIDFNAVGVIGTLTGNSFNLPIYLPATDIQPLSANGNNNVQFQDIYIQTGTLLSGQNVNLNAIGTQTGSLLYIFNGSLTIDSGASITVAPGVNTQVAYGVTVTDSGTLTFSTSDTVSFSSAVIAVAAGGQFNATGTTFSGGNGQIGIGGQFYAVDDVFKTPVILNSASADNVQNDIFYTPFTINSNSSFTIQNNDFANVGSHNVIAAGASNTSINLTNNFWGVIPSQIPTLIEDHSDNSSLPTIVYTPYLSGPSTQTEAIPKNVAYSSGSQNFTLTADISSPYGTVSEGKVTFTIASISGQAVGNVTNGVATATFNLPAATAVGSYDITASYEDPSGSVDYSASSDSSQYLTISEDSTSTTATNASVTFSENTSSVNLSASVTTSGTTVNAGTVTFTILSGSTTIGTPLTVNVSNNSAAGSYTLPAGAQAGTYTIQAVYQGTTNFANSSDSSHSLTINGESTTTAASNAATTFNEASQNVSLSATVGASDTVSEGTETFTILNGSTVVGSPTTVGVTNGTASTSYSLPAATSAGTCTIQAVYNDALGNFLTSSNSNHSLTINAATSTTSAANTYTTYSVAAQTVTLGANVASSSGTVNQGTETFTILSGSTVIGNPVTVNVSNGSASASYTLPPITAASTYTINATYNGTGNLSSSIDNSHSLTIYAVTSATSAANSSALYSISAQTVSLNATVTSSAGSVNEGTVTFTILNGSTVIGSSVTGNVGSGSATANYTLPGGTSPGNYTLEAVYNGTNNIGSSTDASHSLLISGQSTTTAASNATVSFDVASQAVTLNATVTSSGSTVNEGTETFTILNGTTVIGNPVTVNVSSGSASTSYSLPAATGAGTYAIHAVYNGTNNFGSSTDASHSLTINAAASATSAANSSATYSVAAQTVSLSASITSSAGTVNEGTETFTILNGSTVIGSSVTGNVSSGSVTANYTLPAGTPAANYTIEAVYNGTNNISGSSTDASHSLIINASTSATGAANNSATYSDAAQTVSLSASVTSPAGTVNQGTETFTILNGSTVIGNPITINVSSNSANTNYTLPAGTSPANYTIEAVYNGTNNISGSTDTSHSFIVNPAPNATVSLTLDSNSDSGAPAHPGYTNITAPTFDVQVNQAGVITMDFNGNSSQDQTLTVTAAGTYRFTSPPLVNGSGLATATFNAGNSGSAQSTYDYAIDTGTPQVTSVSPTGIINTSSSQLLVTFSEPIDLNSFSPAAIALTGPNGSIGVNQPQLVSGNTYSVSFPAQTSQGTYSLTIAASVADYAANSMAQSFHSSFAVALPDLAITSTSAPSSAASGTSVPVGWEVANVSSSNPTGSTWNDAVYISTKPTLDGSAIQIVSVASPNSSLAPGANYSRSQTVTIPGNVTPGNDYILFVANANGGQAESDAANDTNDVVADPITITAADLQVIGVSGPASGFTGGTALVSWTDVNNGTATATGPWFDNVYTVSNSKGDNPQLLGSFEFDANLAIGASMQVTQPVTLPQTSGQQWFMVTTNATQRVPEGNNYGNDSTVATSPIQIAPVPLPDLVVSSITPPPNGVLSGASVPLSFVVTNQGQAPTSVPVWQDWVILSQDPNLAATYQGQLNPTGPGGDQTLNNQPVILGFNNPSYLTVGSSYQQTVNVPLPISAQGVWYVYVVPDGTGFHHPFSMPEESRTDKLARSAAFNVTLSPPPELIVSNVKAPAQNFSGQPMQVSWTVTNSGTGPTAATAWTDAVYMSTKQTLDSSAVLLGSFSHQGALPVNGSYTKNESVTLPVGVSGQFYFIVKTDLNSQVFQNGQTSGNVASTTVAETVNLTPPPDLEVSAFSLPATVLAGHNFTFSYTVTNGGAGATPNSTWNDALYLSPTANYNPNTAVSLGVQTHQGSLIAGGNYTNTVTMTFPTGMAGSYYLVVDTDCTDVVFELDKTNNLAVSPAAIRSSLSPANLTVTTVQAPATVIPGSGVVVNWTVANESNSDTAVSSWQDSVYIDSNSTLDNQAILLGTYNHFGLLAANGSYTQSQLVTIPINLLGNYNLFVVADSSGTVYEGPNDNNTSAALPITVSLNVQGQEADLADLEVVSVNSSGVSNGNVTVNWTVENVGTGTTNADYWNDDVWMSTNPTLNSGGTDVYLGALQHNNSLGAGVSYSASDTFALPEALNPGNYYYIVETNQPQAPPGNTDGQGNLLVYESNLSNNELSTSSSVSSTPAQLPDLSVSNVNAASTAMSGQPLSLSWQVTNTGADTGAVSVTDSVFLSYDQVFSPGSDRFIGAVTYSGDLANGASYTQNASLTIPSGVAGTYYIIVETNGSEAVPEQNYNNNTAASTQPVQIQLSPPADLVAGTVTIPSTAFAGQDITIAYSVSNNGSNPANGSWEDALYLSPTPVWSINDPLLGKVNQTQDLAPNQSYQGTLTAPLPGVAPGNYHVILRSNILDSFPEVNLNNNVSASLTQVSIDAPALTLGTATNGTLNQGQSAYYKVVVSAGQTLQIAFNAQSAAAYNELYVSFGTMPTRSEYDFRYSQPFTADQEITVPTTQAGAYYILAYGDDVPSAPENYSIEASLIPFSIQTVSPGQVGTGPVTLQINGAQFNFGTTFQLQDPSGKTIDATRVLLQNSATAYVTFDLTGQSLGSYSAIAIQSDNSSVEQTSALTVVPATTNNAVKLDLIVPQAILVGRPGTITITYDNPGNTDLTAPLILVTGQNALFQVPGQSGYTNTSLQLFGLNSSGPFGTLTPGFQGSITIPFEPITSGAGLASSFSLESLADPTIPFPWAFVGSNYVPLNTSPQEWASMVSQAQTLMGTSWGNIIAFLDNNSVQLLKDTTSQSSINAMNGLYNFDTLVQYVVGFYGSTNPSPTTPNLPAIASLGEVTLYDGKVDVSGNPVPLNSSYPTFILIPGYSGYQNAFATLASEIAADTNSYPNGDVNVLVAGWQGATAGPSIDGLTVPWMASLHVDAAGTDLGNLLTQLNQNSEITFGTTTVIGEGIGNDVGNQAAEIVGGLENAIALNSANPLDGFLPANLTVYYQHSIAYETSSLFGAQQSIAQFNQSLNTGDLNDPILQQAYGIDWLMGQIQEGNDGVLNPSNMTTPDNIPLGNDPPLLPFPGTLLVTTAEVEQIISNDPNYIIGPQGSGTDNMVPIELILPYTILFSNVSQTQAPAQQIVVQQDIDPPNLDWGSFRLTSFNLNGQTYSIPANSSYYQTTVDFSNYDVQFTATIDESTGVATWTFTTVDPNTGEIPLNPNIGLLPTTNSTTNSTGIGVGSVSYIIEASPADQTGTIVTAQAAVTFDGQPQLDTPEISNTVDAGTGLTSSVATLPVVENSTKFPVSWSGTDASNGSGVKDYTIYVSDNDGPYTAWLTNTKLTAAQFSGQDGHTYSFYSLATDNVGTVQATPTSVQATTTVDATPPTSSILSLPQYSPGSFAVQWSGSHANGIAIASYDIYVSVNGGAFTTWLTNTAETSAAFAGQNGNSYAFISVATDALGNQEPMPNKAEATTTVDSVAPTSSVQSLPTLSPSTFTLSWNGSDNAGGSGLGSYTIYVSDNASAYSALLTNTTSTSTTFTGAPDHTYTFYSIATDLVGNVEQPPSSPQATTTVAPPAISGLSPSSGPTTGETLVTISGNYLANASAVLFGTQNGIVQTDSSNQIVVLSPKGSLGQTDVTVVTPLGTSTVTSNSEFTYLVPPPDPATTTIRESSSTVTSGNTITVIVQAKDSDSKNIPVGGANVAFALGSTNGGLGNFTSVTDNGDGTYTATFTGTIAGTNTITATINGQVVSSVSPSIAVTPGVANAAASSIELPGSNFPSGTPIAIVLQARDADGNNLTTGGSTVKFALGSTTGGLGSFGPVVDNGNGSYTSTFTGSILGVNTITATIDGQAVTSGSPSITVIPGLASAATTIVSVAANSIQSTGTTAVTLQARDANGNNLTVNNLIVGFTLTNTTGGAQGTFGPITYSGNGIYTTVFTGIIAGNNSITASINGQSLSTPAAPITITPGPVYPANSIVAVAAPAIQFGGATIVTLQARDPQGNNEIAGGLKVAFALANKTGARGTFSAVKDNRNGTYSATFTGTFDGSNSITATINGLLVASSASISVLGATFSLAESTVSVTQPTIVAGQSTNVTLQAVYPKNIDEPAGGLSVVFKLTSASGGKGTFSAVTDHGNGQYTAIFTGTIAGTNTIRAYINGHAITSPPAAVKVVIGPLSLPHSPVTVSAASMKAGGTITVTWQPEDAGGNKLNLGSTPLPVFSLVNGNGTFGVVSYNNKTGTYSATFTTTKAGSYTFETTYNNQAVTSETPAITVTPGPVSFIEFH